MNLGAVVPDPQARDTLLAELGRWRKALAWTSAKTPEQLRHVIGQVRAAVRADAALTKRLHKLSRPVAARRLVMAWAEERERARHKAEFAKLLRAVATGRAG